MKTPRTFILAKSYSFKCHCWRYIVDNRFWFSFYAEIMTSSELWLAVGYMKLFTDRDLNCGRYLVLPLWQYLKSQSAVCQAVYGERQNSKNSTKDSATVAPFLYKLYSYSHYLCALLPTVQCSPIHTISAIIHSCWSCHYAVTVLLYVQRFHLVNCTATLIGFLQLSSQFDFSI